MNLLECFKVKHGITLNIIINLLITQMMDALFRDMFHKIRFSWYDPYSTPVHST